MTVPESVRVLVLGAGFAGIAAAARILDDDPSADVLIIERASEVGGTWRDNTYPGCACDVPTSLYSFSFAPSPDWTHTFARQPELFPCLRGVVDSLGLRSRIVFDCELTSAVWNPERSQWNVETSQGPVSAEVLVAATGALSTPKLPDVPGLDIFGGTMFHSATWNHDHDLTGERVAVIGTGASAVQFVPEIVDRAERLTVFQRTPAWVLPRKNFAVPHAVRTLLSKVPVTRRLARWSAYWGAESLAVGLNGHSNLMRPIEKVAKWNIERSISDPALRKKLVPSYRIGCKRILGSNDYYPTLAATNTTVVTDRIDKVTADSIVTSEGVSHPADVIIYATGFHVTDGFDQLKLKGARGDDLPTHWHQTGINTHLGIATEGFPNLFFLLGPNTGLGHNSVVFMIEQQIKYIMKAIDAVASRGAQRIDVRPEIQEHFNKDIQQKLAKGVWTKGGCTSWYLDSHGVNRTVWPGFTWQYWRATKDFEPADYEIA